MRTEFYLNGQLIDVQDANIAITLQALSFENLGVRRGSYSNVFDLPFTNEVKAALDNCEIVTSLTPIPYQRNTCQIFIDGVQVVDGSAVVQETKNSYRVYVSAGNADFFKSIASVKLVDVDLSDWDHLYDGEGVTERRETEEGFVYPNIDYGFFEYATPGEASYSFRFFQPSFWAKTIIGKAIADLGYTLSGDLLTSLTWRSLAVLCRGAVADIQDSLAQYRFTIDYNRLTGDTEELINFPDRVTDKSALYADNLTVGQFVYSPNVAEQDEIRFEISMTGKVITNLPRRYTNASVWIELVIYDDSGAELLTLSPTPVVFEDRFFGIFNIYRAPDGGILERDINFTYPSTRDDTTAFNALINGTADLTTLRFGWKVRSDRPGYGLKYLRFENLEFIINQVPNNGTRLGGPNIPITVRAANVLPAAETVGDLLLTIVNLEGIIIQVDETSRKIHTARIDSLKDKKAQALDWSGKLDLSERPEIGYTLAGFAQANYWKFKGDDKDLFLDPNAGRGVVFVDNANLEPEKDIFVSKFSPVPVLPTLQNSRTMGRVFTGDKYTFDGFDYNLNADLKMQDFAPRIAILSPAEASLDIQIDANGINFEVNAGALSFERALRDNYQILGGVLSNAKTATPLVLLDLADVRRIDFTVPIYIDYFGGYFYLEQVQQFKVNVRESCFVKLVKLGI